MLAPRAVLTRVTRAALASLGLRLARPRHAPQPGALRNMGDGLYVIPGNGAPVVCMPPAAGIFARGVPALCREREQ